MSPYMERFVERGTLALLIQNTQQQQQNSVNEKLLKNSALAAHFYKI